MTAMNGKQTNIRRLFTCLIFLCLCVFAFDAHATDLYVEKNGLLAYEGSVDAWGACFIKPGDRFYYKYTITNNSNVEAINVVLTDPLVEYVEITGGMIPSQGSCSQRGGLTCELGNIPSFGSATVWAFAELSSNATLNSDITNTATVTADNEIDPTDNSDSFTFTVADVTESCTTAANPGTGCSLIQGAFIKKQGSTLSPLQKN